MKKYTLTFFPLAIVVAIALVIFGQGKPAAAAACSLTGTLGSVSVSVPVTTAGDYRIWSRIKAADATNNSYMLEVDGTSCFKVGDSAISATDWTWVDYQDGNTASKIDMSLSGGNHTLKLIGLEPGVKLDKVLFVANKDCTPTGDGGNCATSVDQTPPTVNVTAPTAGQTVTGTVNVVADASDNSSVSKVDFYINGVKVTTDTQAPYEYSWNTANTRNGNALVMARAYDPWGNTSSATVQVNAQGSTITKPSAPSSLKVLSVKPNQVTLSWNAGTIGGSNSNKLLYYVLRNNVIVGTTSDSSTTFTDNSVSSGTSYSYQVKAYEAPVASGDTSTTTTETAEQPESTNETPATDATPDTTTTTDDTGTAATDSSESTPPAATTTPAAPTDKTAPTIPQGVAAASVSASQINLSWTMSTDSGGSGMKGYDIYRSVTLANGSVTTVSKIGTVSSAGYSKFVYGDTGLKASTVYYYYIIAFDGAGNRSAHSKSVGAGTKAAGSTSTTKPTTTTPKNQVEPSAPKATTPKSTPAKNNRISGTVGLTGSNTVGKKILVELTGSKTQTQHQGNTSAKTDTFLFTGLANGTYNVRVSYGSYKSKYCNGIKFSGTGNSSKNCGNMVLAK